MSEPNVILNPALVKLIDEMDEFKGRWEALKRLSPDRLNALRKVATIESVGSSTRIEGAKLTDAEVETLLFNIAITAVKTRDEQEVAGYAEAMDLVFEAFGDIPGCYYEADQQEMTYSHIALCPCGAAFRPPRTKCGPATIFSSSR